MFDIILSLDKNYPEQPVSGDSDKFRLKIQTGECVIPGAIVHQGVVTQSVVSSGCGNVSGQWAWSGAGQLSWSGACRRCVQAAAYNTPLQLTHCRDAAEDQNFELGAWITEANSTEPQLTPLDINAWGNRQRILRQNILDASVLEAKEAVSAVEVDDLLHEFDDVSADRRRAAVFYVDRGMGAMVRWWLYTWRFLGLDSAEQGLDIVMMTHPAMVADLPGDCVMVEEQLRVNTSGPGRCLYRPYLGVSYRDKNYDSYMNSQECLVGPGAEFLAQYSHILRADLDTFPGPRLLDWWPEGVIVNK